MKQINLYEQLVLLLGEENVLKDELMSRHTTFKIGGPADYLVTPKTNDQLMRVVQLLNEYNEQYYVIGNGSNLLVSDSGYRGVVIQLFNNFSGYEILYNEYSDAVDKQKKIYIRADAGCLLSKLGMECAKLSLSGFEFATGIPGTIGGAVRMNAGAYGGELKDVVVKATVLTNEGNIITLSNDELMFGYRTSIIEKKGYIVLDAVLALNVSSKDEVLATIKELSAKRKEKQPLEYPSAGSTFKRPVNNFAGKLIADAGLKGKSCGGAQVSTKHAGFVINTGNATAQDFISLTNLVKKEVFDKYGVNLELEVKLLGF